MRAAVALIFLAITGIPVQAQVYFPSGALSSIEFKWFSRQLKALNEPSLWQLAQRDPGAAVYRFVWLRTFHHPMTVRFVLWPGGSGSIYSRVASGMGGYEPGRLIRNNTLALDKSRADSFLDALDKADFWTLPAVEQPVELNGSFRVTLDGAEWIMEGVKDRLYHFVVRTSPEETDPLREAGILALKLGRIRVRKSELY